ncbi:GNAT family N-acetyltransferase, partial [Planctomycetota bacterium]
MQADDAPAVAALHIQGIETGFIGSLGLPFVTTLYRAIATSHTAFGLVAEQPGGLVGFVAFTENTSQLYREVIRQGGFHFVFVLAGKLFSWPHIRKMAETLLYPKRTKQLDLPASELLAIAVDPMLRRQGIASRLLQQGLG